MSPQSPIERLDTEQRSQPSLKSRITAGILVASSIFGFGGDTTFGDDSDKLQAKERICFDVEGNPGDAAVVNLTPVLAESGGNGQLISSDVKNPPLASNVNFGPGTVDPNVAIARIGSDGEVCFVNSEHTSVHLVADHLGTIAGDAYSPAQTNGAPDRKVDTRGEEGPSGNGNLAVKVNVKCSSGGFVDGVQLKTVDVVFPQTEDIYGFDGSLVESGELSGGSINVIYEDGHSELEGLRNGYNSRTNSWETILPISEPAHQDFENFTSSEPDPTQFRVDVQYKSGNSAFKKVVGLVIPHCFSINPNENQESVSMSFDY